MGKTKPETQAAWDRANTTRVSLKFNNNTDADISKKLSEVENKQRYIKALIRADLNGCSAKTKKK